MRKIFMLAMLATLAGCTSDKSDATKTESMNSDSAKSENRITDTLTYPYTPQYSNKFAIGDANNSLIVLQLYQDWDNNTIENSKNRFADSVIMVFSDGTRLSGTRDSVLNFVKKVRSTIGSITSDLTAWMPLRSTDKNEDWVAVWFTEHRVSPAGKKDSSFYQETWRLNKDGKVDRFYQYEEKVPKK